MQSEFDFINRIRDRAARQVSKETVLGIGDDAAVLSQQSGRETLVTVDLMVEDIDFKRTYTLPDWLGHKTLAVSLSDIAAMGGAPRNSLLTLGIPKSNPPSEHFWEEFFSGYFALAEQHGVTLIGGDISSTPDRLMIDSFVIGSCVTGRAIRRSGARVGDGVYITGSIGASAAGLKLLLRGARAGQPRSGRGENERGQDEALQNALRAHLRPEPRVDFGLQIGEFGLVHSMIDVSDGFGRDLAHICEESRVAAIIDSELLPIAEEARMATEDDEAAFSLAVNGGEDFELILTGDLSNEAKLMDVAEDCRLRLTRIGEIIAADAQFTASAVWMRRGYDVKPLSIAGFDHFAI
jgi:thiamine-monophosphate kinase